MTDPALTPDAGPDRAAETSAMPRADGPGLEGSPRSGSGPEPDLETAGAGGRAEPGVPPPPGSNQPGTEPISPQGDRVDAHPAQDDLEAAAAGSAGTQERSGRALGEVVAPGEAGAQAVTGGGSASADTGTGAARMTGMRPLDSVPPAESSPGDAHGVSVASTDTMEATSEDANVAEGVRTPSPDDDLLSGEGTHVSREGGPAAGQGSIVGRQSAPDGEVGRA